MRHHARAGFSPVELIVAIVIFAIGVLAMTALLGAGYRYEGRARLDTQLTILAESKLEDLRAIAGTDLPDTVELAPGGDLASEATDHHDTIELDGRTFRRLWQVELGPAGVRRVSVRVQPLDPPAEADAILTTQLLHD